MRYNFISAKKVLQILKQLSGSGSRKATQEEPEERCDNEDAYFLTVTTLEEELIFLDPEHETFFAWQAQPNVRLRNSEKSARGPSKGDSLHQLQAGRIIVWICAQAIGPK